MTWQEDYLARFYRGRPGWRDGTREFHDLCRANIPQGARILEVGAGPTNPTSRFLASLGTLTGADPDPAVRDNTALAAAATIEAGRLPFADAAFDAVVSNYVVEHVADPSQHLAEIRRVLAPHGRYVFRTPNRHHYVATVSWLTPHWFHALVANRLRGRGHGDHDPYPTSYAMNTERAVTELAAARGFAVTSLRHVEKEPSYAMLARPLVLAGVAYERTVNASEALRHLRSNLFVVLTRS